MSRMQELVAEMAAGNVVAVSPPPQGSALASAPGSAQPYKPQTAPALRAKPDLN